MKYRILLVTILLAIAIAGGYFLIWPKWPYKPIAQKQPKIPVVVQPEVTIKVGHFSHLDGWEQTDLRESFQTFQVSCRTLLRRPAEANVGSLVIPLSAQDWQQACQAALKMQKDPSQNQVKLFFEIWFTPVTFYQKEPVRGLFTGYYMPLLQGSLVKTSEFNIPIYGPPNNLITFDINQFDPNLPSKRYAGRIENHQLIPFYTRKEINEGAIDKHAQVLVWVNSAMDRLDLEIQGSGVAVLPNGEKMYLGYHSQNGAPYTAIAKVLIDKKIFTRDTASMQAIRAYFIKHPDQIDEIINQNKSFVFFRILKQKIALGAQGVGLTPGYSLAIDRKWVPLGMPVWLSTTHPGKQFHQQYSLQRLMIAQDTGGAIKGMVRGDVYWGAGKKAFFLAGKMRNQGHYWLLMPKNALHKLPKALP